MKISAFDIRPGNILEHEKGLWRVLKTDFVKPGKGGAFVQVEMKNIETGTKSNTRFRSGESMEKAVVEPRTMQYLYADATGYVFMDNENFEQIILSEDLLEGQTGYLLPNTEIGFKYTPKSFFMLQNIAGADIKGGNLHTVVLLGIPFRGRELYPRGLFLTSPVPER